MPGPSVVARSLARNPEVCIGLQNLPAFELLMFVGLTAIEDASHDDSSVLERHRGLSRAVGLRLTIEP